MQSNSTIMNDIDIMNWPPLPCFCINYLSTHNSKNPLNKCKYKCIFIYFGFPDEVDLLTKEDVRKLSKWSELQKTTLVGKSTRMEAIRCQTRNHVVGIMPIVLLSLVFLCWYLSPSLTLALLLTTHHCTIRQWCTVLLRDPFVSTKHWASQWSVWHWPP